VKLFPEIGIGASLVRLSPASVSQGVTEAVFKPVKLNVVEEVAALRLLATITKVAGAVVESLLKAETVTPVEGESVAPIR
jgi:hypothetical protein